MGEKRRAADLRLVIDNNVVISVLLFPTGSLSWLQRSWQSGEIVPLVSPETVAELVRVLGYPKFNLTMSGQASASTDTGKVGKW